MTEIPVTVSKEKRKNSEPSFGGLLRQERFWATLPHVLSAIMILGLMFGGDILLFSLTLATASIYIYHADKSPRVQFHARQAIAMQLLGTIGWLGIILSGIALWLGLLIISAVLILVLIGIILTPLVALALPVFLLATLLLPLSTLVFGVIGAWETWNGRTFRYPYVADWLDKRLGRPNYTVV